MTIDRLYNWCLSVKKVPVVVKDGPGFLVNRILAPFLNETSYLLEEGVSINDLDQALINFGMPMGPCRLMDEIGLDVCTHVSEIMQKGLGHRMRASQVALRAAEDGLFGKKNKKGFYLYGEKGEVLSVNDKVSKIINPKANKTYDERTIQMRLILAMINEASYILEEKIVDEVEAVDLGAIFGLGFPPFRGGPLRYADDEGIPRIYDALKHFQSNVSDLRYAPSTMIKNLAESKSTFYSDDNA